MGRWKPLTQAVVAAKSGRAARIHEYREVKDGAAALQGNVVGLHHRSDSSQRQERTTRGFDRFATLITSCCSSPSFPRIGPTGDEQENIAASGKGQTGFPRAARTNDHRSGCSGPIRDQAQDERIPFECKDRSLVGSFAGVSGKLARQHERGPYPTEAQSRGLSAFLLSAVLSYLR